MDKIKIYFSDYYIFDGLIEIDSIRKITEANSFLIEDPKLIASIMMQCSERLLSPQIIGEYYYLSDDNSLREEKILALSSIIAWFKNAERKNTLVRSRDADSYLSIFKSAEI